MSRTLGARGKKVLAREAVMEKALTTRIVRSGRSKLTAEMMLKIAARREAGELQEVLAAEYGVHPTTIGRVERALLDTRGYAKQALHAAAGTLATIAVTASEIAGRTGDAAPALELLDRLDVAPKRAQDAPGAKILIVVGQQDPSALPPLLAVARGLPTETGDSHAQLSHPSG